MSLNFGFWNFQHLKKRIKGNTVSIRYMSINPDRKFNRKEAIIQFFLETKRREQETY